jgi:hypothetical protein
MEPIEWWSHESVYCWTRKSSHRRVKKDENPTGGGSTKEGL